jgi:hypothetical protein
MRSAEPWLPTPVFLVKEPDTLSVGRSYVRIDFTSSPRIVDDAGLRQLRRLRYFSPRAHVYLSAAPADGSFGNLIHIRSHFGKRAEIIFTPDIACRE